MAVPFVQDFANTFNKYLVNTSASKFGTNNTEIFQKEFCNYAFANLTNREEVIDLAQTLNLYIKGFNTKQLFPLLLDAMNNNDFINIVMQMNHICTLFSSTMIDLQTKDITKERVEMKLKEINSLPGLIECTKNSMILERTYLIEQELYLRACQKLLKQNNITRG